jgi:hypothetical protein
MTSGQRHEAILRFRDGKTIRTAEPVEIDAGRQRVHISGADSGEFGFNELKAVFFLSPESGRTAPGRGSLLSIEFSDGEVLSGIAPEYNPTLPGFYLYPTDDDRVERVFVVASAIVSIDVERL